MFHNICEKIIVESIKNGNDQLKNMLFQDIKLVDFLLNGVQNLSSELECKNSSFRKGYLGYLTQIGNFIDNFIKENNEIKEFISGIFLIKKYTFFFKNFNKINRGKMEYFQRIIFTQGK